MDKDQFRLFVIIFIVLIFLLAFGIRYLRSKENMAMIERGMEPAENKVIPGNRLVLYACLLFGFGLGLLAAHIVEINWLPDSPGLAKLILVSLFLGGSLLVAIKLQSRQQE